MPEQKRPRLDSPFKNTHQLSKGGQTFTYIPTAEVIDRLNTVLGVGAWSFTVPESFRDGDFVLSRGRLEACGGVYEQWGGQKINKTKGGDIVDLGDDYKGASSDALKKACQSIGLGLYLSLGHPPLAVLLGEVGHSEDGSDEGQKA